MGKNLSLKERYIIKKYTYNSYDMDKPNRFFERLNKAMRGDYKGSDKDKLVKYGYIISEAICRANLQENIVCYRGVDDDLLHNIKEGTIFAFDQFVSTSIIEKAALKNRYKYVILVAKKSKGAYIEDISSYKGQYEFLLDYSCKYKLISKSGKNVYLEVVE